MNRRFGAAVFLIVRRADSRGRGPRPESAMVHRRRTLARALKPGSTGPFVRKWQLFLRGRTEPLEADGRFGPVTAAATKRFQARHRLDVDGIVGNQTLGQAALLGFELVDPDEVEELRFPPAPDFPPLVSTAERQRRFGPLRYEPAPRADNPEAIRILNGWEADNIVTVTVPQLAGIASGAGSIRFHRKAAAQLLALWAAWEKRGLLARVRTYAGAYVPRFIRGSRTVLSNHAFGTAFDLNAAWNALGAQPALAGMPGCLLDLVPVAHEYGFYWGGHFDRRDGMHFEVARLVRL